MISIHPTKSNNPYEVAKGWRIFDFPIFSYDSAILRNCWSPIIWEGGDRQQSSFLYSCFCALDFDSPDFDIHDADLFVKKANLAAMIGTTKSHMKDKGGVTCHRFRLVIPWSTVIRNLDLYRQNMSFYVDTLKADRACKDGARFFFPCSKIIYVQGGGKLGVRPYKAPKPVEKNTLQKYHDNRYTSQLHITKRVKKFVVEGDYSSFQGRQQACFIAAGQMFSAGMSRQAIEQALRDSPFNRDSFGEYEMLQAINSAEKSK